MARIVPNRHERLHCTEWERGYLVATAEAARCGQDTLVEELLRALGITNLTGVRKYKLDSFDRVPLERVIRSFGK